VLQFLQTRHRNGKHYNGWNFPSFRDTFGIHVAGDDINRRVGRRSANQRTRVHVQVLIEPPATGCRGRPVRLTVFKTGDTHWLLVQNPLIPSEDHEIGRAFARMDAARTRIMLLSRATSSRETYR
jgi:hypothetical protein